MEQFFFEQVIYLVTDFLELKDILSLRVAACFFYTALAKQEYWKSFLSQKISVPHNLINSNWMENLLVSLHLSSFFILSCILNRLQFQIFGYWTLVPSYPDYAKFANGEIILIAMKDSHLIAFSLNRKNFSVMEYKIEYNRASNRLYLQEFFELHLNNGMLHFDTPGLSRRFLKLTLPLKDGITGLVKGYYSGNGEELLLISSNLNDITDVEDKKQAMEDVHPLFGGVGLVGLKIMGDKYVPAHRLSFKIYSNTRGNASELVNVLPSHVYHSYHNDTDFQINSFPEERLPYVAYWCNGLGQINRTPGSWNPEYKTAFLVVYTWGCCVPLSATQKLPTSTDITSPILPSFSIVFGADVHNRIGHMIDFYHCNLNELESRT